MNDLLWALCQVVEALLAVFGAAMIVLIVWFESDCKESAEKQKEMYEEYEEFW